MIRNETIYVTRFLLSVSIQYKSIKISFIQFENNASLIIHLHNICTSHIYTDIFAYLYTRHTACVSWHGFQDASNTTTRFAPTRLIPNDPARVDTRNRCTLGLLLNSFISFSRSNADVLPSRPEYGKKKPYYKECLGSLNLILRPLVNIFHRRNKTE